MLRPLATQTFDRGIHAAVPPDGRAGRPNGTRHGRCRVAAFIAPASAANLAVGLGTDVTAIDPHYHNLTPNNNVAAHIFGYLVERNEKSQLQPGLATEWKTIDPLTWEFKLRNGVKFHDGSDFTAADVVASIERVPTVPNSPSPFTAYTKQIKEMIVVDPLTIRFKTAAPYPLDAVRHDAGRDRLEGGREGDHRRFQHRQGGDRHRALQARPLREERSHRACAQRRVLGRQDAVGEGDACASCRRTPRASRRSCPATCR